MNQIIHSARRWLLAITLAATLPLAAHAGPLPFFVPYSGAGNLSVFDAVAGTGAFLDARGIGLAFVNYDPAGVFNNYTEIGLLAFDVPEPGTLALATAGLMLAGLGRRRMGPLNWRA